MRARVAVIGLTIALAASQLADRAAAVDSSESSAPAAPSYTEAKVYVDSLRFSRALPILQELVRAEPDNADAWNLLAFSQRQLGDIRSARQNYDKALALDPSHKGAHEYLGELFLMLNDLESARQQLLTLTALCPAGCEQREDLQRAIDAFTARQGS